MRLSRARVAIFIAGMAALGAGAVVATFALRSRGVEAGPQDRDNNARSIDDLVKHFASRGLSVGARSTKFYGMVGASDGAAVEILGDEVELYKYDLTDPGQRSIVGRARAEGTMTLIGTVPVRVNGSFILAGYQDHAEKARILEAFQAF